MTAIRANPASQADRDHVERGFEQWRRKQAEEIAAITAALATSPAIRGGEGRDARMAIQSGELTDTKTGRYRLTFFGPDGPHGHVTKDTELGIAEEANRALRHPIVPMTDDEVIAWTSTEEFEKGSKVTAFVQAENTLRWMAQKIQRGEWASAILARANDLGTREGTVNNRNKPYDAEALDAAIELVVRAIRELPTPNPRPRGRVLVANPPWVTKALADSYEILDDKVPAQWLPQLASVKRGASSTLVASLLEYGCGAYGCVLATLDPKTVLKVTSDETEAEFAAGMSVDLVAPICVEYHMVVRLSAIHDGRQVHLLWREAADEVGKLRTAIGSKAGEVAAELVDRQHRAAQNAYAVFESGGRPADVRAAITAWLTTCEAIARGRVPELRALGRGLVEVYERQRILFGDIHIGNLGLVERDGVPAWVITDPGNVAVIWDA